MQDILITLLIFGVAVLLASTRVKEPRSTSTSHRTTFNSDRASTESQPSGEYQSPAQGVGTPGSSSSGAATPPPDESSSTPSAPILVPLLDLDPEVNLPLATSLPLQEVMYPESNGETVLDLVPESATIIDTSDEHDSQSAGDRDYQSVLDEIAQLGQGSHETAIATLIQHVHHANPMIRATAAMTLGELAAQNHGQAQEKITTLLNSLLQDSNSEVRLQAAAALGRVQLPVDLA